ncbi:cobalamin binding intrinsic factor isoform X1 [Harpia harpyja]|uniref:cobalamin binding intrinsic factor isoform X1 n=1 Tax=Harpia harpyja TaxID=202280 RepID=UPI0022B17138|nr:cobalamin binding intrinsic factor isoform X1 [Harpia harpyja]
MLGVAFGIGVLLALVGGTAAHGCVAPYELVSKMLQRLEESVKADELPNPSVLLAMNLVGATGTETSKWLLQQIQQEAVKRAQKDMTSGEVALYVLALLSSCQNPRHVHALGQTINLLEVLQEKTDEEMASLDLEGVPKTTLYSVSLDALALCLAEAGGYQGASVILAKQALALESQLSVDTRAVAALAMACTYGETDLYDVRDLLQEALWVVTNGFLNEQEEGGMIGNIYSMGLALQVLGATSKFYFPREWDCAQAFSVVYSHDYRQPMAIAQVLPALVGMSYLEAASLDCTASTGVSPTLQPSLSPKLSTTVVPRVATITVHYSIINKLQGRHFSYSISVRVPDGSTLLKVLQAAAAKKPDIFSFQTEQTSWGPMVVSIHGLAANPDDKTYWKFLSGSDALQEGVGTYKPWNREHIQAVFSLY